MKRWIYVLAISVALVAIGALAFLRPQVFETSSVAPRPDPTPATPTPSVTGLPDLAPTAPGSPTGSAEPQNPVVPSGVPRLLAKIRKGRTFEPCPPTRELGPLRVASFNIHGGVAPGGRFDLAGIAREISEWDVDAIMIQEIHRFRKRSGLVDMPAALASALDMNVAFGPNFSRPPESSGAPLRESGTAILTRFEIIDSENRLLPNLPGFQQRGLLRARVEVKGQPIDLYSTHLDHQSPAARRAQARTIATTLSTSEAPVLLGGDFNAGPGSTPMRALDRVATDTWREVGQDSGLTAPSRRPRARIDYVFSRGAWTPRSSSPVGSDISDHRAVLSDLSLEVPNDCG